jgi:hypothetical protein
MMTRVSPGQIMIAVFACVAFKRNLATNSRHKSLVGISTTAITALPVQIVKFIATKKKKKKKGKTKY